MKTHNTLQPMPTSTEIAKVLKPFAKAASEADRWGVRNEISVHDRAWSEPPLVADLRAARDLLSRLSAVPQPAAVPSGWRLVPEEPTEEMLSRAAKADHNKLLALAIYNAMLSAAPQPDAIEVEPLYAAPPAPSAEAESKMLEALKAVRDWDAPRDILPHGVAQKIVAALAEASLAPAPAEAASKMLEALRKIELASRAADADDPLTYVNRKAAKAIALAEASLGPTPSGYDPATVEEIERLRRGNERERTAVADAIGKIRSAIGARAWLRESRGSYAWDDARYQAEFGAALDEIDAALDPLRKIAADWSDCPTDPLEIAAIRALSKTDGGQG